MTVNNDPLVLLQQAEQQCKQRLNNDPNNPVLLHSLAEVCRKLGNLAESAMAYQRLFQLNPHDEEAGYMQALLGGREWLTPPPGIRAAPFVLLKNFLPRDFHDTLLPFMMSVQKDLVPIRDGYEYIINSREPAEFRGAWEGWRRFRDFLAEILPRVLPRLCLPHLQIGQIDVQVRAYQDGQLFSIHQDAPANSPYASRMLNFVYYFHKEPRPYTGGELMLFDSDIEADRYTLSRFTRVVPEDNSLIIFPCRFYHCVIPIRCPSKAFADSRFTINGHVHQRES